MEKQDFQEVKILSFFSAPFWQKIKPKIARLSGIKSA
jgi:hypothetical protein